MDPSIATGHNNTVNFYVLRFFLAASQNTILVLSAARIFVCVGLLTQSKRKTPALGLRYRSFFLYPASNAYNSYFDKDEKSIGGLKNPPPVRKELYYLALLFDGIAPLYFRILAYKRPVRPHAPRLWIGFESIAVTRLFEIKKYAISAWLITGLFQGLFSFVMCYIGINRFPLETAL